MPDALWESLRRTGVPTDDVQAAYAVGDTVCSGDQRGTVVSLGGEEYANISVVWNAGEKPITYPADAPYLRKLYPWETNQK